MIFAMKVISKQTISSLKIDQNIVREIKIQSYLNDPFITHLYGVFSDDKNLYMLLEPLLDGNLWSIKKKHHRMSERTVSQILKSICRGVQALHSRDIIHRDIKL